MPREVLQYLEPRDGGYYLDGTVGGGGHARLILEASSPTGRLIGLDRDPDALRHAAHVLSPFGGRVELRHARLADAEAVGKEMGVVGFDGVLFDFGVSSWQLDAAHRGFSFRQDGPLDMRMDTTQGVTAAEVVNTCEADELAKIFREYGEERFAGRIARRIVAVRGQRPLSRTLELADLVCEAVPGGRVPGRIHPATRVFQALRIHVNGELDQVAKGIEAGFRLLKPGGRLVVITFHSLEDRIVKRYFQGLCRGCICPPGLPLCVCNRSPEAELLNRRGISGEDADPQNPRARSAMLRAVRKMSN